MIEKFLESDLYEPIRHFFEEKGYVVRSEVKNCDVVAQKEKEYIIIELKKAFTLQLVYQLLERQKMSPFVFAAIPRPEKQNTKQWKNMLNLLKKLEIGLLTVALNSERKTVETILEPSVHSIRKNTKKQKRFEKELEGRTSEFNKGGVSRKKIITAYREKAIELACMLEKTGQMSYKELKEKGLEQKQLKILQSNFYGWFERVSRGVYRLTQKGKQELNSTEFQEVTAFYREKQKA